MLRIHFCLVWKFIVHTVILMAGVKSIRCLPVISDFEIIEEVNYIIGIMMRFKWCENNH